MHIYKGAHVDDVMTPDSGDCPSPLPTLSRVMLRSPCRALGVLASAMGRGAHHSSTSDVVGRLRYLKG